MLPRELIKKIRRIEIKTNRLVNESLAGDYHSVFKGRGMEFAEVREYQPGDDIRTIDWNVTARTGHPFVKVFTEERELTVVLIVDISASEEFGTTAQLKGEILAEIGALLAFSATRNNDRVGLLLFTDEVEQYIPPRKGRNHVLRVIRELLYYRPRRRGTSLKTALEYANRVLTKRSVVFIVSDFLDRPLFQRGVTSSYEDPLKILQQRHEVIALELSDPRERDLPPVGLMHLRDAETGETLVVDASYRPFRDQVAAAARRDQEARRRLFQSLRMDYLPLDTDAPYDRELVKFFKMRARRIRT